MAEVEIKIDLSKGSKFDQQMREWLKHALTDAAKENPTAGMVSRIVELQQRIDAVLLYLEEFTQPCQYGETGVCTHEERPDLDHIRVLLGGGGRP